MIIGKKITWDNNSQHKQKKKREEGNIDVCVGIEWYCVNVNLRFRVLVYRTTAAYLFKFIKNSN